MLCTFRGVGVALEGSLVFIELGFEVFTFTRRLL